MNSKRKGNKFERVVAKWLTEWTGYKFERNRAGSGAWHSNKDSISDITCTDSKHAHRCRISVECKTYKDIKFEHVILGNKSCDILKFWQQATNDATRGNRVPFLCMRYNSMPKGDFFFVFDHKYSEAFSEVTQENHLTLHNKEKNFTLEVYMASSIKEYVDYKKVHKFVKRVLIS